MNTCPDFKFENQENEEDVEQDEFLNYNENEEVKTFEGSIRQFPLMRASPSRSSKLTFT